MDPYRYHDEAESPLKQALDHLAATAGRVLLPQFLRLADELVTVLRGPRAPRRPRRGRVQKKIDRRGGLPDLRLRPLQQDKAMNTHTYTDKVYMKTQTEARSDGAKVTITVASLSPVRHSVTFAVESLRGAIAGGKPIDDIVRLSKTDGGIRVETLDQQDLADPWGKLTIGAHDFSIIPDDVAMALVNPAGAKLV